MADPRAHPAIHQIMGIIADATGEHPARFEQCIVVLLTTDHTVAVFGNACCKDDTVAILEGAITRIREGSPPEFLDHSHN